MQHSKIFLVLILIGILLISGCIERESEIFDLVVCSKVNEDDTIGGVGYPLSEKAIKETTSLTFYEGSKIYVCVNITTSLRGDSEEIRIYKILNGKEILLNVSIVEDFTLANKEWVCKKIDSYLPKLSPEEEFAKYKIKYILSGGKNKKEREISFKVLRVQKENQTNLEKFCKRDSDCACGVHIRTGECFYGNKNFVDTSKQCPDFCTGIVGNFEIKCIEGECRHVNKWGIIDVVNANNKFAFELYKNLGNEKGNVFFSPFSISTAFAMTYEGARGKTAEEIQSVFHFPKDDLVRREGFLKIIEELNKKNKSYELHTANALWAQKDYKFLGEYFETIERYYKGNVTNLDFKTDTENSRLTINQWVENQTNNKIKDIIPKGILNVDTRLVITNAIYFKGKWKWEFDPKETKDMDFKIDSTNIVKVKMMYMKPERARFNYADLEKLQILELPYKGEEISMLILLPKQYEDYDYETGKRIIYNYTLDDVDLSSEKLKEYKSKMKETKLDEIYLPKFKFEKKYFMNDTLIKMGMPTAFSIDADFSGMDGNLFIDQVIHQAFVEVNEEGTEAAAATAVIMAKSMPSKGNIFCADHPFIFIIQHKKTGNILFIGRVVNPKN